LIDALTMLATATEAISYRDLGLSPIALDLGWFQLRWYSLGYLAGIIIGWWYLLKLIDQPGAPMARRHVDDMVFYATLGIILGGRLGYVLFYKPMDYLADPLSILRLWDGGMSFHGGVLGVTAGILWMARRNKLDWLRVHDYVACCAPFGIFLVRLANFVNSELWGGQTDVPWAVRFCTQFDPAGNCLSVGAARHPSQLYEALLEGVLLFVVLWWMFWRTRARYQPGKLVGAFLFVYGVSRFLIEFIREADSHLIEFAQRTGLHMGQWLSVPMILAGLYLILTANRREGRVRPVPAEKSAAESAADEAADEPADEPA
jgi:phosphatidylglycerol---prolipoprotein diacylglyceryl transferase